MNDNAVLFISLGTSPAIVPEAFLLPSTTFSAVHVLTTERPDVGLVQEFFREHAAEVTLRISRVEGFNEFTSENDHFRFEEVMYRWLLASATTPDERWICVAGGFKTMSAAMQKAAAVLGAAEVFHVLADSGPPGTVEEVLAAAKAEHLHWIKLGPEPGWPQLRSVFASEYPLDQVREQGSVSWVAASDTSFRDRLRAIVERSHRIAGTWETLPDLPFTELATWSEAQLAWLNAPVDCGSQVDQSWIEGMPKVELHCHLGGFATSGNLLETVRRAARNPNELPSTQSIRLPEDWPLPRTPVGLDPYRRFGDNNGSALLRDPGCLRRQCELLYDHLLEQRVLYAEIRCSPANYADESQRRTPWLVLEEIRQTFQDCMKAAGGRQAGRAKSPAPCHVNLLIIGTRQSSGDYRTRIARHLSLAVTAAEHWTDNRECRVVGVDLAGFEDKETRAQYFREEFLGIHRCGLALTVHAGENDDAEGIWRAVFDLNARRLGHALSLGQSQELLRSVIDRGIGIEMCPYANLQIRGFTLDNAGDPQIQDDRYPLKNYLAAGAKVTVNTDNIGISAATLTDNLLLAARLNPELTRLDWVRLQRNALDSAFLSANVRSGLVTTFAHAIPQP